MTIPPEEQAATLATPSPTMPHPPDAERRQLTVMFCDLVGSTPLSEQLDPEDLREVVPVYHQACAEVIQRFEGHIAQLLGDGLLVYFGSPQAHDDDARRAVQAGLGIIQEMDALNTQLSQVVGPRRAAALQVRVGIHTGLAVVGEMGGRGRQEQLALGGTPNLEDSLARTGMQVPSPSTGEGEGGGEAGVPVPHPGLPLPGGKADFRERSAATGGPVVRPASGRVLSPRAAECSAAAATDPGRAGGLAAGGS